MATGAQRPAVRPGRAPPASRRGGVSTQAKCTGESRRTCHARRRASTPVQNQANVAFGNGFTLLELLVVIAIITILAALLLPVLSRARASGLRLRCGSNLHQLGIGLRMYVDDFQKYPAYSDKVAFSKVDLRSSYWDSKLLPFVGRNKGAYFCPGSTGTNNNPGTNWSYLAKWEFKRLPIVYPNQSYAYNAFGVGMTPAAASTLGLSILMYDMPTPIRLYYVGESQILAPSDMIAIGDYDAAFDDDGDGDPHPESLRLSMTGRRHAQRANMVFCDAHVEGASTNRWLAKTLPDRRRWNNDHQPHSEIGW